WWLVPLVSCSLLSFFFQAEDGIRDRNVTGVQTCALPISGFTVATTGKPACSRSSRPLPRHWLSCTTSKSARRSARTRAARRLKEIGRASCRERGEVGAGGGARTRQRSGTERQRRRCRDDE